MKPTRIVTLVAVLAGSLLLLVGCGADDSGGGGGVAIDRAADAGANAGGTGGSAATGGVDGGSTTGGGPEPEQEEEFEFSAPAVVGDSIFVANETLNSVAVIDSQTLAIETVLTGRNPTDVVGPEPEFADNDDANVMVLNEGEGSVTVVDPENRDTKGIEVAPQTNAIRMDPTGRRAIAWFDDSRQKRTDKSGDLSSVTVVSDEAAHQVAVGFHVRDVRFGSKGERAIIWTDDGVSVIDLTTLSGDTIAPPISLVPPEFDVFQPEDLEIETTDDARYVVTRSGRMRGLVLLDVEQQEHHVVPLFEVPTDVDLVGGETPGILTMLRQSNRAVRADLPDGLVAAADELADETDDFVVAENGDEKTNEPMQADAGLLDAGSDADAGPTDSGLTDTDNSDAAAEDTSGADVEDSGPAVDVGTDATTGDAVDGGDVDGGVPTREFPEIDGFEVIDIDVDGLGAASVSDNGETALLYTTIREEKRVILLDLSDRTQRVQVLEKKVRGAISDDDSETFIVYNQKQEGDIPPDAAPSDPEYIARSWGVTVIDIDSAAVNLLLMQKEPGPTALWSPEQGDSKAYIIFEPSAPNVERTDPGYRDVTEVNLDTFRRRTHRLPSLPEGLGPIQPAGKVFVSQQHPEGRMTFIDAETAERQTITGYQLNSGIE